MNNGHGGYRPGAGRKKSTTTTPPRQREKKGGWGGRRPGAGAPRLSVPVDFVGPPRPPWMMTKNGENSIWTQYGLRVDEWLGLWADQRGCCAICLNPFGIFQNEYRRPNVDHCHSTGKVRGLLCRFCNIALGGFKDDLAAIRRAEQYLLK